MRLAWCVAVVALATLAGCHPKVIRVDMDPARLAPSKTTSHPLVLMCDYRIGDVIDARADGGEAGGLSRHAFQFADAAATVRQQLSAAGLSAEATTAAPAVSVRILQLYLTQNLETKIPVAVYRISVADEPAFVLRSQIASMNWNGTQNEAYAAYARVMADLNRQLVARLNRRCAAG